MTYKKPRELATSVACRLQLNETFCDCCGLHRWFCDSLAFNPWKYVVKEDKEQNS